MSSERSAEQSDQVNGQPPKIDYNPVKRAKRLRSATGIPHWLGYRVFRYIVVYIVGRGLMKAQLLHQDRLPQPGADFRPGPYNRNEPGRISCYPFVLAPNHTSEFDIAVAGMIKRPMAWLSKPFFVGHIVFAWINQRVGCVPMVRAKDSPDRNAIAYSRKEAMAILEDDLSRGIPVVVYPQGTRQDSGAVGDVFLGAAILADRQQVPLVPLAVYGLAKDDQHWRTRWLRRRKAIGIIMDPIRPQDYPVLNGNVTRAEAMMKEWQIRINEGRATAQQLLNLHK